MEINRIVDYLNISSFMVEVERVGDLSLKNRPIVIAPLFSDSAKIWDASLEAKGICEAGFKEIYLTTGHTKKEILNQKYLKEIISKRPQFNQ